VVGTLRYIPPERFLGQSDARGDVYSLGLALYSLLTLRPAFYGEDRHQLLERILHDNPPPPRRLDPSVPRDLETIVLKAMARAPEQRYHDAGEFAADLQRFIDDRPILARRIRLSERFRWWCQRNPVVACLTAGVATLLVAITAVSTLLTLSVTAARDDALEQKRKAQNNERQAEENAEEGRRLLARQYVANGVTLMEAGDLSVGGGAVVRRAPPGRPQRPRSGEVAPRARRQHPQGVPSSDSGVVSPGQSQPDRHQPWWESGRHRLRGRHCVGGTPALGPDRGFRAERPIMGRSHHPASQNDLAGKLDTT
jgi:hypothetical protein